MMSSTPSDASLTMIHPLQPQHSLGQLSLGSAPSDTSFTLGCLQPLPQAQLQQHPQQHAPLHQASMHGGAPTAGFPAAGAVGVATSAASQPPQQQMSMDGAPPLPPQQQLQLQQSMQQMSVGGVPPHPHPSLQQTSMGGGDMNTGFAAAAAPGVAAAAAPPQPKPFVVPAGVNTAYLKCALCFRFLLLWQVPVC